MFLRTLLLKGDATNCLTAWLWRKKDVQKFLEMHTDFLQELLFYNPVKEFCKTDHQYHF